ncbi:glycosyltransferase family 8 protein [Kluyvera georgiana]|uniref:glycosyltransferase family 8 protein n=1 Tax=Kluyvera georgiana TaxID=73098 RepID=UPI003D973CA3
MHIKESIKNSECFDFFPHEEKSLDIINVAYGVDVNFQFGASVSIVSLLINNISRHFSFHIFTDSVSDEYRDALRVIAKKYQSKITLYTLDGDVFSQFPSANAWSRATYFRFAAFEYLSEFIDKVMYIDADVICNNSIDKFYYEDINNVIAAVIPDVERNRIKAAERFSITDFADSYFNAGVILLNLALWKSKSCFEQALSILRDSKYNLAFLDQDVLNLIFRGDTVIMERDFNCIYGMDRELIKKETYRDYIRKSTVLIHYVGLTKPWHEWAIDYESAQPFKRAFLESPWGNSSLVKASSVKLIKRKSKHEKRQGHYLKSIMTFLSQYKC